MKQITNIQELGTAIDYGKTIYQRISNTNYRIVLDKLQFKYIVELVYNGVIYV